MRFRTLRTLYWLTFLLTILILFQNVGIVLLGLGIFILPVIILHVLVARKLEDVEHKRLLVGVSTINLLVFSLLRPEGAHAIYMTGLSSVLDLIGISGRTALGEELTLRAHSTTLCIGHGWAQRCVVVFLS